MKIVVFGATGPTGIEIVKQALAAGHEVTAIARTPAKMALTHERLSVHKGDVLQSETFAEALEGQDTVISSLGAKPSRQPVSLYSKGIENIIRGMEERQLTRLFCITSAALKPNDPNLPFFFKYVIKPLVLQRLYDDMIRMETLIEESSLAYTLLRPPRLMDGPMTGVYRVEEGYSMKKGVKINRADVAHYIVNHLDDGALAQKGMTIAY